MCPSLSRQGAGQQFSALTTGRVFSFHLAGGGRTSRPLLSPWRRESAVAIWMPNGHGQKEQTSPYPRAGRALPE